MDCFMIKGLKQIKLLIMYTSTTVKTKSYLKDMRLRLSLFY